VPRIAGVGVVLLLASAGAIAALLPGQPHTAARRATPPATVEGIQAVGLVDSGPPVPGGGAAAPRTLVALPAGLGFIPGQQAAPGWTADQMAGGTYIFIYISNGQCLASAAGRRAAVLQRCNLGYGQRWRRQDGDTGGYWQLRNAGNGRCLTAGTAIAAGGHDDLTARLEPCRAQLRWPQRLTFAPVY
jgi:hypothetical protein